MMHNALELVQRGAIGPTSDVDTMTRHGLTRSRILIEPFTLAVGKVKRPCTTRHGRHDVLAIPTQISSNALEQGQRRVHKGLLRRGIRPTIMPRLSGHACRLPTANPFSLPRPGPAIPGHCDVMGEAG